MIGSLRILKLLGQKKRFDMLMLLYKKGELRIVDISNAIDNPQYDTSHHMAKFRRFGFVRSYRHGNGVYYSISPTIPRLALNIIKESSLIEKEYVSILTGKIGGKYKNEP